MTGYITKGIGGFYYVKTSEGVVECKPRGIFRKQKITPVAGDVVTLETENGAAVIAGIAPRRNVFVRPPMANLDVLFIVLEYFFESFVLAVYGWWLFVLVPMLAVSVRRLHDANMSGWWALAPCIGNVAGLCIQMSPVIKVVSALGTIYPTQFADTLARGVAQQFNGGAVGTVLVGLLLQLAAVVLQIWLYTRPGKPEGRRFDKRGDK